MELNEVLESWKSEIKELYMGLQNLESQKKEVNRQLKESELGKQKDDITKKIKQVKKMIDQRRFEASGLEKALLRVGSQREMKQSKISSI
ncbi:MAG: hypothetical protein WC965_11875 [Thiohalomonadaceae bacterium]